MRPRANRLFVVLWAMLAWGIIGLLLAGVLLRGEAVIVEPNPIIIALECLLFTLAAPVVYITAYEMVRDEAG